MADGQRRPPPLLVTLDNAEYAFETHGFNCGPAAFCAVTGMAPFEALAYFGAEFIDKRYTNPTLMFAALRSAGVRWKVTGPDHAGTKKLEWPSFGLARIQWGGPWTQPGVPMAARYRKTHWVATCAGEHSRGVFDVNALNSGGWVGLNDWATVIVPGILSACEPRADGKWWITHSVEIET
jgi:hypothetical protein